MQKECNVVMLATDKKSYLCMHAKNKDFAPLQDNKYDGFSNSVFQNYHLYILSDDEIKEGDWVYDTTSLDCNPLIHKIGWLNETHLSTCDSLHARGLIGSARHLKIHYKKIIATTDESLKIIDSTKSKINEVEYKTFVGEKFNLPKPSQEFIELFISKYNAGNPITKVMVEYDEYSNVNDDVDILDNTTDIKLKLNPDNTINIKTIKDSWNRDEVIKLIYESHSQLDISKYNTKIKFLLSDWIKQNL